MSQTLHRQVPSRDRVAAFGIAAVVAATVLIGALVPNHAAKAPLTAAEDPGCVEWSNGCQVCQRWPDGPSCSLPGIACEPGAVRCLRRSDG